MSKQTKQAAAQNTPQGAPAKAGQNAMKSPSKKTNGNLGSGMR